MDTALTPILTDEGRRRLLEGIGQSTNYRITHIQVGSGESNNGYLPEATMIALMASVQSADATGEVTTDGTRVHVAAVVGPPTDEEEQATPGITEGEYEIYEIGFFITDVTDGAADGESVLFAIYAREPNSGPLLSKTPTTDLLLGFDLLLPDLPADHTIEIAEDAYFKFPLSTETQPGVLRLATFEEVTDRSNGEKAVTPLTLKRAHSLASADGTNEAAVIVDAAGNVGVGTTTPDAQLHISTATANAGLTIQTQNNANNLGIRFRNLGELYTWHIYRKDAGDYNADLAFAGGLGSDVSTFVERVVFTHDGKVGIGTSLPDRPLSITGTDNAGQWMSLNTNAGELQWHLNNRNGGLNVAESGVADARLFLAAGGKLGVGTDIPSSALSVYGSETTTDGKNAALSIKNAAAVSSNEWYLRAGASGTATPNGGFSIADNSGYRMVIDNAGRVGIGTQIPRTELDTGTGVLSGAVNDYIKAQFALSGGGTVTWGGPGNRLAWTERFIALGMEKPDTFSNGYVNIAQPTNNIPADKVWDGTARSVSTDGVVLNEWESLYAVHTVGGDKNAIEFRILKYDSGTYSAPSNWILLATVNNDNDTVKLGTGVVLEKNSSSTNGSPIPRGVIMMWNGGDSTIPSGWALCDGSNDTPDLRSKFIVGCGTGASYNYGDTGGANSVTLTEDQMPEHNHANGSYKYLLAKDGKNTVKSIDNSSTEPKLTSAASLRSAGGGTSHENRPPYFALCYIMKL